MAPYIVLIILFLFFVLIIFMIRSGVKNRKAVKAKAAQLGAKDYFTCLHHEGLVGLRQGTLCTVYRCDDKILIDAGETRKYEIQNDKLQVAVVKNEQELIEKGKSVVGRAVIGTLLVPGLGTIIGGMSGIGTKQKKGTPNHYLILNYVGSTGELQAVTFKNNLNIFKMQKFCNDLNNSIAQFQTTDDGVIQL
ncbi:hypothetical protein [Cohnella abietis]|uniref:Uncharacterized protein n=1 Tax=Cohnella abietis TaxID=2507935 RepID=A0A3T1D313_9BACL|nr:hypothetical protein [Cohnella abietis]BBI32502.1 hypothetical protein KCTCHS21_19010 [Cohnella abietis]